MGATNEQLREARKKAVLSPNHGKHGKRKLTLLKEEAIKETIKESLEDIIPPKEAYDIHKKLLHKQEVIRKYNPEVGQDEYVATGQPDTNAAKAGLDMWYKATGRYAPEKHENLNKNLNIQLSPEIVALVEEEIKCKKIK